MNLISQNIKIQKFLDSFFPSFLRSILNSYVTSILFAVFAIFFAALQINLYLFQKNLLNIKFQNLENAEQNAVVEPRILKKERLPDSSWHTVVVVLGVGANCEEQRPLFKKIASKNGVVPYINRMAVCFSRSALEKRFEKKDNSEFRFAPKALAADLKEKIVLFINRNKSFGGQTIEANKQHNVTLLAHSLGTLISQTMLHEYFEEFKFKNINIQKTIWLDGTHYYDHLDLSEKSVSADVNFGKILWREYLKTLTGLPLLFEREEKNSSWQAFGLWREVREWADFSFEVLKTTGSRVALPSNWHSVPSVIVNAGISAPGSTSPEDLILFQNLHKNMCEANKPFCKHIVWEDASHNDFFEQHADRIYTLLNDSLL